MFACVIQLMYIPWLTQTTGGGGGGGGLLSPAVTLNSYNFSKIQPNAAKLSEFS